MAVGASAQTETLKLSPVSGWGAAEFQGVCENFTLNYDGAAEGNSYYFFKLIGTGNSIKKADYKGMEVEFSRADSESSCAKLRLCYNNGPWNKYFVPGETTLSVNFEEDKRADVPATIDDVVIQLDPQAENASVAASIDIKKIYLIKSDDTKELLKTLDGGKWGTAMAFGPMASATLKIPTRWSTVEMVDANNDKLTFDPASKKLHTFTLELEEATELSLQILGFDNSNQAKYPGGFVASADKKTFTMSLDPEKVDALKEIRIQAITPKVGDEGNSAEDNAIAIDYPQVIKVKSITRTITTSTGVEKVEVLNAANAEFVNAAGQKVGKNYKGLVINKATGKKFINK